MVVSNNVAKKYPNRSRINVKTHKTINKMGHFLTQIFDLIVIIRFLEILETKKMIDFIL